MPISEIDHPTQFSTLAVQGGQTALIIASMWKREILLRLLIDGGASVNAADAVLAPSVALAPYPAPNNPIHECANN